MKHLFISVGLTLTMVNCLAGSGTQTVNSILGDKSFIVAYGHYPSSGTNEILRIRTHLRYVENLLEQKDVSALSELQRSKRNNIIILLHWYWTAGIFPSNFDYPMERRPCFIDKNGNICAVGYLIEKTEGRAGAEGINSKYQYKYIFEMNDPAAAEWAQENGLSLEECAMIQPNYGTPKGEITTGYGISSSVLGGVNLAVSIANFSASSDNSNTLGYIGLLTGTAQIVLGAANVEKMNSWSSRAQNNLSYFNIALGTTTFLSSTIRMIRNKNNRNRRNAYNIYSYPNYNNSLTMGITIQRRI